MEINPLTLLSAQNITRNTIGITATVPVEVILAAGFKPVDLNNLFITSDFRSP
jgi:hypothetical protein